MFDWFKNFFNKFGGLFRSGLDKFLFEQTEDVIKIAQELLKGQQFTSTDAFARALWAELKLHYKDQPGTWLTIIANLAIDALKKKGKLAL